MSLGACRLKRRILVLVVGSWAILTLASCGGSAAKSPPSGLPYRVIASQEVTAARTFGALVIIDGQNDSLPRAQEISAGTSPTIMAISPARNILAAFDFATNSVYAVDTTHEATLGKVQLPGYTNSMVVPTSNQVGYAAVPTAFVAGFPYLGGVEVMNFSGQGINTTIAVTSAQTVVSNSTGDQLLVFNGTNSVYVVAPGNALPLVDLSCYSGVQNSVCTIVPGFDRPVFAIVAGTTAYIFNCGAECGGTQASIQTLDLNTFAVGVPVPVNGATYGFVNGSTLYVAGNGTPTGQLCASLTAKINAPTAATYCGTLDILDLGAMTDPYFNSPSTEIAIPDGYHDQMDMSINGQLFIGSHTCTNIGNVGNPNGEVRGCLSIYNTNNNSMVFPPDNGDVNGLQSFTSRNVEYVAENGDLRVYDTTKNILLINDFLPEGTINIVGYVGDIKAVDFF
jgi:hypothetical protein